MCSTRSQRCASAVSWVTSTRVVPCWRWPRNSSSMISPPVASSRLPVGSSATTMAGFRRDRARQRDALLLAARQFGRIVAQPAAEADGDQLALGAGKGVARAGKFKRHGDIFQRRHGRDEVKGLKDDADILAAKAREFVFVELAQVFAGDHDRTAVGAFQPGHHHQTVSICPNRTDQGGRRLRRVLYSGRCLGGYERGRRRRQARD